MTARLLERQGYQVITATSAKMAERLFQTEAAIDAVLLDLKMPDRDGWTCLDALRRMNAELPIIICSGFDPRISGGGERIPGTVYLQKPFRVAELERALKELEVGQSKADPQSVRVEAPVSADDSGRSK